MTVVNGEVQWRVGSPAEGHVGELIGWKNRTLTTQRRESLGKEREKDACRLPALLYPRVEELLAKRAEHPQTPAVPPLLLGKSIPTLSISHMNDLRLKQILSVPVNDCDPSTWKVEKGGPLLQGQPQLYRELVASLDTQSQKNKDVAGHGRRTSVSSRPA